MKKYLDYEGLTYFWDKIKDLVSRVYKFKGTVATFEELPAENNNIGDVYDVGNGMNYAWDGTKWDALGMEVNVESITNDEIDSMMTETTPSPEV